MLSKKYAIVLASGASILAIGLSAPSFAQVANPNNTGGERLNSNTTISGANNIVFVANVAISPSAPATGTAVSGATTTQPSSFALIGGGTAATATTAGGFANVGAFVDNAYVNRTALGTGYGNIVQTLVNPAAAGANPAGLIGAKAYAFASGTTATNSAYAQAHIRTGVAEYGTPYNGTLNSTLTNNGAIHVTATATALAPTPGNNFGATANAGIDNGIRQYGLGTNTDKNDTLSLTNTGTIHIDAYGHAQATHANTAASSSSAAQIIAAIGATAHANVGVGISQAAQGNAPSASLTNSGAISVGATAFSTAVSAYAFGFANNFAAGATADAQAGAGAHAVIGMGIEQVATASGGNGPVSLDLTNAGGTIAIEVAAAAFSTRAIGIAIGGVTALSPQAATANASAVAAASAFGQVSTGIAQLASGAPGTVSLTNTGSITIWAGNPSPSNGFAGATASAHVNKATAYASALGTANAQSFAGARAQALVGLGIDQSLTNGAVGAAIVTGTAVAPAVNVSLVNGSANAPNASIAIGARAFARAYEGTAYALANAGLNNATAAANADAYASAVVLDGIVQTAIGGAPTASLTNTGTIAIRALGTATGYAHASAYNFAFATAFSGNQGRANAFAGDAAYAVDQVGIQQYAGADYAQVTAAHALVKDATASVSLNNNTGGQILIDATAYAYDKQRTYANAYVQAVNGAHATGSAGAFATGQVGIGIAQQAQGPNASAALTNSGFIQVLGAAYASAPGSASHGATAYAYSTGSNPTAKAASAGSAVAAVGLGINQSALTLAGGNLAVAAITNNAHGVIQVAATAYGLSRNGEAIATAHGSGAAITNATGVAYAAGKAEADIGTAIFQYAAGPAATAKLTNSGQIQIRAGANASGVNGGATAYATNASVDHATAYAGASAHAVLQNGIEQVGLGSGATISLANSGTLNVSAVASSLSTKGHAAAYASSASSAFANARAGADAKATLYQGIVQRTGSLGGTDTLTNTGLITIAALAKATSYSAHATAYSLNGANGFAAANAGANAKAYVDNGISQLAEGPTPTATLTNGPAGAINIQAAVTANAYSPAAYAHAVNNSASNSAFAFAGAQATAYVGNGIGQTANGGTATLGLTNAGIINVLATAAANEHGVAVAQDAGSVAFTSAGAYAFATINQGIFQNGLSTNGAAVTLTNSAGGAIKVGVLANANGNPQADARAVLNYGVYQTGYTSGAASNPTVTLTNSGSLALSAGADAVGRTALANGYINFGIQQIAFANTGVASDSLTNTNTLSVNALATAAGTNFSTAIGQVFHGIDQHATGTSPAVALNNSGALSIEASGKAMSHTPVSGPGGVAVASAIVGGASAFDGGITQVALGSNPTVALTNSGTLDIGALAVASAYNGTAVAAAIVRPGVMQTAAGAGVANLSFTNSKSFTAHATAESGGVGSGPLAQAAGATAHAYALGVQQNATAPGVVDTFSNTAAGTFAVTAKAAANGANLSYSAATAEGLSVSGDPVHLADTNAGKFNVTASAAGNAAFARALGIQAAANANAHTTLATVQTWKSTDLLDGTLTNTGTITVQAVTGMTVAGQLVPAANPVGAFATGVSLVSSINDLTVNNSGRIEAVAQTGGSPANASGIVATGYTGSAGAVNPVTPTANDLLTINNQGGTIIARQSIDNGATFQWGNAIDVSGAPNRVAINLTGTLPGGAVNNGYVYGNILLSTNPAFPDTITVSGGETQLDGQINPGATGTGNLIIASGGTLYLPNQLYSGMTGAGAPIANTMYTGAAGANVANFTVASGGTLAIEIGAKPTNGTEASYPHITANTVTLGSNSALLVRLGSYNGLYGNSYTDPNVIVSNTPIAGAFGSVTTNLNSPLLTVSTNATNGATHVDVTVTRVKFGAVAGLTPNQASVGGGLEGGYSSALSGPAGALYGALFTQNAATYQNTLDQLSGEQYAGYLQSLNGLASRFNDLISNVTDCPDYKASVDPTCQRVGKTRIWAQFNGGRDVKKDGTYAGLGGYHADQYYLAAGADYQLSDPALLGLTAGYIRDDLTFNRFGGRIKSEGYQIGAYGVFDAGPYYAKAVVNYSSLSAQSTRNVSVANAGPGGAITGLLGSNPKADIFSAYGEVGYHFSSGSLGITPYAVVEYTDAKLKAFSETGLTAANLAVADSSQDRVSTELGLRLGGSMGRVTPEVNVGWRHQFGSKYATVNSSFADLPGSAYTVQSPYEKPDSAFVDIGLAMALSKNVVGKIGYQGRFNGNNNSNAGMATLIVSFGGFGK